MHANRLNAFVAGDADAIGEVLSGPLGEPALDDANVFRQRAAALVDALAPVLVWIRDHEEVVLNIETVRLSVELSSIWKWRRSGCSRSGTRSPTRRQTFPSPGCRRI
jgi:intracellular multiplication protein IcmO